MFEGLIPTPSRFFFRSSQCSSQWRCYAELGHPRDCNDLMNYCHLRLHARAMGTLSYYDSGALEHFFPFSWECHQPNWLIFFRGVGIPPTSYSSRILLFNLSAVSTAPRNLLYINGYRLTSVLENLGRSVYPQCTRCPPVTSWFISLSTIYLP